MIIDPRALAAAAQQPFDVAIVGAGCAGLAVAWRLRERGLRILLLEAGGANFDRKKQDQAFRGERVEPAAHPPVELYRRRVLGGTTTIWGGRCIPLDESDFDSTNAGDGGVWPIGAADVTAYIPMALSWLDAGAAEFTAERALPLSSPVLLRGIFDDSMSLSEIERFSCPLDVWRRYRNDLEKSSNIVVASGSVCTGIATLSERCDAQALEVVARDGARLRVTAKAYVIAAGGLETPRLLLASRSGRPAGLGNYHDLVGRFYMTHLLADVGTLSVFEPGNVWLDYERSRDDIYVRRLLKLSNAARRRHGLLNVIARPGIPLISDPGHGSAVLSAAFFAKRFIISEYRRRLVVETVATNSMLHLINVVRDFPELLKFGAGWMRRRTFASRKLPSLFLAGATRFPLEWTAEQAPNRSSRIMLAETRDIYGVPRLNVSWAPCDDDRVSLQRSMLLIKEGLASGTAAELDLTLQDIVDLPGKWRPQGGHHIGTARMGTGEHDSVVDGWGALWEAPNVYLAGSCIFPRSGAANPTLMLVALAMRTADRVLAILQARQ